MTPGWPRGQQTKWKMDFKSKSGFRKLVLATGGVGCVVGGVGDAGVGRAEGQSSGGFSILLTPPVQGRRMWAALQREAHSFRHPTLREGVSEKEGFLE